MTASYLVRISSSWPLSQGCAVVHAGLLTAAVAAQAQGATIEPVPTIVVTGERVPRTVAETASSVAVFTEEAMSALTSNAVLAWCGQIGVEWHYIAPGKPMQNGYVESLTAACATSFSTRPCS